MKNITLLFFSLTLLSFGLFLKPAHIHAQSNIPDITELFITDFHEHELRQRMERNATAFLSEINKAFKENRNPLFDTISVTESYHEIFNRFWRNGRFYVPDARIIESTARTTAGYYEVRNIPMILVSPEGEEHYEEGVIQFSANGIVMEFRIGLPAHRYNQLLRVGEDVTDIQNRQQILSFVENFRTAYNLKDINFIRDVFSDQALIIVGRVVENTGQRSAFETQVEFMQYTKDEYITRLERVFRSNAWIDVRFENISIRRHPNNNHRDIYGVTLTQYYNSSIYSDVGYLFLLIDFRKPEEPMIHVRTWQPQNVTPEEAIFSIGDMEIF